MCDQVFLHFDNLLRVRPSRINEKEVFLITTVIDKSVGMVRASTVSYQLWDGQNASNGNGKEKTKTESLLYWPGVNLIA